MFVLPPPPPRYTNAVSPWGTGTPGGPIPIIETNNTINRPSGPEHQFSVGEGTYVLREDIHLVTPQPHPSEAPVTNLNPLSTAPQPIASGTKLSLVQLKTKPVVASHLYRNVANPSIAREMSEDTSRTSLLREKDDASSVGNATASSASRSGEIASQKFGGGNAALTPVPGKPVKKPKNNIAKSNSSFVSRIITHEHLTKRMAERNLEDLLAFANINRAFNWLDMSATNKQEPLSKILFTKAHPICHDVNVLTRNASHIDVIIGFSTGDIIWFDPMSNKYARINKNGAINLHAVTEIKWLPGSENLFLASHNDGSLVVYDKEKEDAPFVPEETPMGVPTSNGAIPGNSNPMSFFNVKKSVKSANQKTNPLSYWTVAKGPITAFQFSPDLEHIAVVSEDQCLRVINFMKETLLDVYSSYYGGFTCVCWSPDGRYIVTGGQDDLVSIWSFSDRRIIARCEGHHSWVSAVAFDPWRCDDRTYRFGSTGNDCRLLLWDFSVAMLHKPKAAAHQHRGSMSSAATAYPVTTPAVAARARGESQSMRLRSDSNVAASEQEPSATATLVHGVEERARTAVLPPVMSKEIDPDPLSQLVFREDAIVTTCVNGHLRTWDRPHIAEEKDDNPNGSEHTLSAAGS